MKRIIALFFAAVLSVTVVSPVGALTQQTDEFDSRAKKCVDMCVESSLPAIGVEGILVNGNQHLLGINHNSLTLYNFDSRKTQRRVNLPTGQTVNNVSTSRDHSVVYLVTASDSTGALRYFRVDTLTLELAEVTPESPSNALYSNTSFAFTSSVSGDGFFLTVEDDLGTYVCGYNSAGAETGCSSSFQPNWARVSNLYFHSGFPSVTLMGDGGKLFTFNTDDFTFGHHVVDALVDGFGETASDGLGNFYVAEPTGEGVYVSNSVTNVYRISSSGVVETTLELPGFVNIRDLAVPEEYIGTVFVLGSPKKANGTYEKFNVVYRGYLIGDALTLNKTAKLPTTRGDVQDDLFLDSEGRYAFAFEYNMKTSVIPVGWGNGANSIHLSAVKDTCFDRWTITWDFLNLKSGPSVKFYNIYTKRASSDRWVKIDRVRASASNEYVLEGHAVDDMVKVMPDKIKVSGYDIWTLESLNIPRPDGIARQPRC